MQRTTPDPDRARCGLRWFRSLVIVLALGSLLAAAAAAQVQPTSWITRQLTARMGSVMAYDVARQRTVLFGGAAGGSVPLSDTWELEGGNWSLRTPATIPPMRHSHALAYDVARQRIVLFGGLGSAGVAPPLVLSDTWEWDGSNWSQRTPTTSPPARYRHALAYDVVRQRTVLFGGNDARVSWNDTWEWDGSNWSQRTPTTRPSPRAWHALAYDSVRQRTVLFGGYEHTSGLHLADTWEWDGSTWLLRTPVSTPPTLRLHALAYDASRQRVVLFGGHSGTITPLSETWEWDGANWTRRTPMTSPPARAGLAMAYDAARQRTVVFGGYAGGLASLSDTWEWDGGNWSQRANNANPPPFPWMAYDFTRQRVVLVVSPRTIANTVDTWEWDGARWTQRTPATSPPGMGAALAHDIVRQRTVLFGGADGNSYRSDTWVPNRELLRAARRFSMRPA